METMRANVFRRKVCLQTERVEKNCRWQSVIVSGEFREIKRTNEKFKILQEFAKRFEHLTPVEAMMNEDRNPGGLVVYRIEIKHIAGMAES